MQGSELPYAALETASPWPVFELCIAGEHALPT
jgi:hypothetical protein